MFSLPPRRAVSLTVLLLAAALAACSKKEGPAATQATYTPPPLATQPTAPWCTMPAETAAFHVAALKSQLMVAAISCKGEDKYNGFITQNRSALLDSEKAVNAYFRRHSSRSWEHERDDYVTQLANAQADRAQLLGDQFCSRIGPLLDEAQKQADLTSYAATKTAVIPNAYSFNDCAGQSAEPAQTVTRKQAAHANSKHAAKKKK